MKRRLSGTSNPRPLRPRCLVAPETYTHLLHDEIPRPLYELGWYRVFDGESVRAENVSAFLRRITFVENQLARFCPALASAFPLFRRFSVINWPSLPSLC